MLSFLERDIDISVNILKKLEGKNVSMMCRHSKGIQCIYLIFKLFPYNSHLTAQA